MLFSMLINPLHDVQIVQVEEVTPVLYKFIKAPDKFTTAPASGLEPIDETLLQRRSGESNSINYLTVL